MRNTLALALVVLAPPAQAAEAIAGPIDAEVIRVIDGDTIQVLSHPWLDTTVETRVRLSGIDTPEKGARAKCPAEAAKGERASKLTRDLLPPGAKVQLSQVVQDKYGGRVVAKLQAPDGRDVGATLIKAKLAYPYDGGTKRSWCK